MMPSKSLYCERNNPMPFSSVFFLWPWFMWICVAFTYPIDLWVRVFGDSISNGKLNLLHGTLECVIVWDRYTYVAVRLIHNSVLHCWGESFFLSQQPSKHDGIQATYVVTTAEYVFFSWSVLVSITVQSLSVNGIIRVSAQLDRASSFPDWTSVVAKSFYICFPLSAVDRKIAGDSFLNVWCRGQNSNASLFQWIWFCPVALA